MPISPDDFRTALSRFASGVTVVTTKDSAGRIYGITVSAFCSVSLEPPLVLICIEKVTGSHRALSESGMFVVNVLDQAQVDLSEKFASPSSDKFEDVDMSLNIDGIPVLSGCLANLECKVWQTYEGGDHTIFVGEVDELSVGDGDPLLYFRSDYRKIGN
jgi:flavin reductase (DIM6/NTAB) family NADH-FMN oxidoreductase RutF